MASIDSGDTPRTSILPNKDGPSNPVSKSTVWPLYSTSAANPHSTVNRGSSVVLSYRIVRRKLAPGISVGWGVRVGSACVGGTDAGGDGTDPAQALDRSRTKVKLTVMGPRGFILFASLLSEWSWMNSMRGGCKSCYTTLSSTATTLQGTQEVQRDFWCTSTNADLPKNIFRPAIILLTVFLNLA